MATAPVLDMEPSPTGPLRPRQRRWKRIVAALAGLVVVLLGLAVTRYVFRDQPGAKEIEEALRQFRAKASPTIVRDARYPAPAAGVYELAGQGSEHISFPPSTQRDSAVMPATVTHLPDNCWRWHLDYNVAHWDEYDFCPRDGQLFQVANRNSQSWDLGVAKVKNLANFACDQPTLVLPRNPKAGDEVRPSCAGTNTSVAGQTQITGPVRTLGIETLTIDGKPVAAVHQRHDSVLTGAQQGTVTEDWWHSAASGLPLRVDRHTEVGSRSPLGGTITYSEEGSWRMRSLEPRI